MPSPRASISFLTCAERDGRAGAEEARAGQGFAQRAEVAVAVQLDLRPVVEAGAAHGAVVEAEARHADDVQRRAGRGAQARDVAGVRRYLRLEERDAGHGKLSALSARLSALKRLSVSTF